LRVAFAIASVIPPCGPDIVPNCPQIRGSTDSAFLPHCCGASGLPDSFIALKEFNGRHRQLRRLDALRGNGEKLFLRGNGSRLGIYKRKCKIDFTPRRNWIVVVLNADSITVSTAHWSDVSLRTQMVQMRARC